MIKELTNWLQSYWNGLRLMARPTWILIGLVLNVFATLSIVLFFVEGVGKVLTVVTGVFLLGIVSIVTLQAPYRGQAEIRRLKEHELEDLKDFAELRRRHLSDPANYIWLELEAVIVEHQESDGRMSLRCQIRSTLMSRFQFTNVEGFLLLPAHDTRVQTRVTFRLRPGETYSVGSLLENPEGGRRQILLDAEELDIADSLRRTRPRKIAIEGRLDISISGWPDPVLLTVPSQVEVIINRPLVTTPR